MQALEKNGSAENMTIEELASASGMTVRNIRAHCSRGLLPSPDVKGRKGYYNATHLDRLKEITFLQDKGYSLAAIQDLLYEMGLGKLDFGVVAALGAWKEEGPATISLDDLFKRFPVLAENEALLQRMKAIGIYKFEGNQVIVPWPALLDATEAILHAGATMESILALQERTLAALGIVARDVINFFVTDVINTQKDCGNPELVAKMVAEIRPLALASFRAWFSHAMESEIASLFDRAEEE
jgi:DNA-binding transcriptional MerR regulator